MLGSFMATCCLLSFYQHTLYALCSLSMSQHTFFSDIEDNFLCMLNSTDGDTKQLHFHIIKTIVNYCSLADVTVAVIQSIYRHFFSLTTGYTLLTDMWVWHLHNWDDSDVNKQHTKRMSNSASHSERWEKVADTRNMGGEYEKNTKSDRVWRTA